MSPRQTERSEHTRATLIVAARALFGARGYAAVGTPEIVAKAGSSRGALYHHFKDKQDLFRAVYEQLAAELAERVAAELAHAADGDLLDAIRVGLRTYLAASVESEHARLGLTEAPAVLGWREWRAIDEKYALGLLTSSLRAGMAAGVLRELPVEPLAHLVLAAVSEAGLLIAGAADPRTARAAAETAALALLDGLRTQPDHSNSPAGTKRTGPPSK